MLRPEGCLVVYDNAFQGEMEENPEFGTWLRERFLTRYPSPPRDRRSFDDDDARQQGFCFLGREDYENDVRFSVKELARYLETQSNVIATGEEGSEDIEEVHTRLLDSLYPLFLGARATFAFGGYIWYLRPSTT